MLRATVASEIHNVLAAGGFFASDDFKIAEGKRDGWGKQTVEIVYRHRGSAHLRFAFPSEPTVEGGARKHPIEVTFAPGVLNEEESVTVVGLGLLLKEIEAWRDRLKADIQAEPTARAWAAHQALVEELMEKVKDIDSEATFTAEELQRMMQRLDTLESKLASEIRERAQSEDEIKRETARLHLEVEALRMQLTVLTKKRWFRTAMSRLVSWGAKKENQEFLLEAAKTTKAIAEAVGTISSNGGNGNG